MSQSNSIILFDGLCNFCNSTVLFLIKMDKNASFKFASLQADSGQALLNKFNLPRQDFGSIILIQGNQYFVKSTAILIIIKSLGGYFYPLYLLLSIIPRPISNFFYDLIAKYRFKIWGVRNSCMVPSEDLKERFL
jgi:predicted DCC family thiol-disulfide oxidoreductase YuxK